MKRLLFLLIVLLPLTVQAQSLKTENVILITFDGMRWQEVFTGADSALIGNELYVENPDDLRSRFWAADPATRRQKLMPFFWSTIARQGQLYGDRLHGGKANVTNHMWFSYPGYNEILTGFHDDRIDSNDKIPNPNVTVLEFVNEQDGFQGKVAAFGSWDTFPFIINEERSGVPVNAGFEPVAGDDLTPRETFLNELQKEIPSPFGSVRLDAFTYHFARQYLEKHHPRLLYIAFGETDDFAHEGKYDAYLTSAHQTDAFIRGLWEWLQSNDDYRDKTTLVITTDHGRGTVDAWTSHGADVPGADQIWMAVLGPDTQALGEVNNGSQVYQNQVAATVANLLGLDYHNQQPIGQPLETALPH
ncbi:MAG TPA: alkaline phosphatase family protein [Rhodothermales bacterium]|nr:alkaline phosphatase family protein [Rhodothermales bacterium]